MRMIALRNCFSGNHSGIVFTAVAGENKQNDLLMVPRDLVYIIRSGYRADKRTLQELDTVSMTQSESSRLVLDNSGTLLRDLTGGEVRVTVPAATVRQAIANLEQVYPGIEARLCDGGRLRPSISVVVDGQVSSQRLRHKLGETSEVHFLPAISGG